MPLQTGDIRLARSANMSDVDNGGGPPTSQLIPDGASNAIFPDISEDARTGGLVEVRHLHGVLRNTDTEALLGANIIVAEPPDDDNVSITLIKSPGTFARRPDLVKLIEATSTPGSEFSGFLLENHVEGQRSLQIGQRPGVEPPGVNTTLVLVQDEGLPTEYSQFVRIRRVTVSAQVFTEVNNSGQYSDFVVQVASCELFSPLAYDFPGSSASRLYARQNGKTKTRRVNVTDAGTFYSASRLTDPVIATSMEVMLESVYTQIVPNTRTETPLLNQRPGGQRTLNLVDAQGSLQVSAAAHTQRILVTEENQGFAFVAKLTPPPAPNSVSISYMALNAWATVIDDGTGGLGDGPGSGTVDYLNGNLAITTDALPDYNTCIIISWADTAPYINNCAAGQVVLAQHAEFELDILPGSNINGSTISWPSGGATRNATVSATGVISGDATGRAIGSMGKVFIKPTLMPDAGANFTVHYTSRPTVIETLLGAVVDSGGYALMATSQEAVPETIKVRWTTARKVTTSSGADLSGSGGWKREGNNFNTSAYTQKTESATSDTQVIVHQITDNGAGGFGAPEMGTVNYGTRIISLRVVSQGAVSNAYRSDHEDVTVFSANGVIMKASA